MICFYIFLIISLVIYLRLINSSYLYLKMSKTALSGQEVRIAGAGNVDSGKTSTIACLTHGVLDDGRGSARQKIFLHPHERETGRTSSISRNHMKAVDGRYLTFVDLAGHEKYLRTTMHGITGGSLDYGMIMVGANMGVTKMTREHMSILVSLKIPIFCVVSKMDICPPKILENTMNDLRALLAKTKRYKLDVLVDSVDKVNDCLNFYRQGEYYSMCPIFQISNKTGERLDLLKGFVTNLPVRKKYVSLVSSSDEVEGEDKNKKNSVRKIFRVEGRFTVKGVGLVVSGKVNAGTISKGDVLFIGPVFGQWVRVTVKSLHDDFENSVDHLEENQAGCLAFNVQDKKIKLEAKRIRKGVIVADQPYRLRWNFKAVVAVTAGHATTIGVNYQPVINCKTVEQAAKVCSIDIIRGVELSKNKKLQEDVSNYTSDEKEVIRCGDTANITLHFMHRPEFLNVGDLFVFREGNLRGIGKIQELLGDDIDLPVRESTQSRRERRRNRKAVLASRLERRKLEKNKMKEKEDSVN